MKKFAFICFEIDTFELINILTPYAAVYNSIALPVRAASGM